MFKEEEGSPSMSITIKKKTYFIIYYSDLFQIFDLWKVDNYLMFPLLL